MNKSLAVGLSAIALAAGALAPAAAPGTADAATTTKLYAQPLTYTWHVGVKVQPARWVAGGPDGGHFTSVGKPVTYRVLPTTAVRSAVTYCGDGRVVTMDAKGNGTTPCATKPFFAKIGTTYLGYSTVTLQGSTIVSFVERYTP